MPANTSSSYMRDLQRLLQSLTSVQQTDSIVSLLSDSLRYIRFVEGAPGAGVTEAPQLMPAVWFTAEKILRLTEGLNQADSLIRSAKLLGTLQLLAPDSSRRWRELQFGYKLLYRATLALRLLDHALEHKLLNDEQWQFWYAGRSYNDDDCSYRNQLQLPLLAAIMLQDAGLLEDEATMLLGGYADHLDTRRRLNSDEREHYLKVSQRARDKLLQHSLTPLEYRGNSRAERDQFLSLQQQQLGLIKHWLNSTDQTQHPSQLLKVVQLYSSMVLPGRDRYQYESLPKASLLLRDAVSRRQVTASWVQHLLKITGVFPQGYGIAFIPQHSATAGQKYELAIVNQLYPPNLAEPLCRVVSRNLQYRRGGHNCQISVKNNLYFKPARQRLSVIAPQRLQEILTQLTTDWQPGQIRHYLPRCWQPQNFFNDPNHHNLWNNAPQYLN